MATTNNNICGFDRNVSTTIGNMGMKFGTKTPAALRMNNFFSCLQFLLCPVL